MIAEYLRHLSNISFNLLCQITILIFLKYFARFYNWISLQKNRSPMVFHNARLLKKLAFVHVKYKNQKCQIFFIGEYFRKGSNEGRLVVVAAATPKSFLYNLFIILLCCILIFQVSNYYVLTYYYGGKLDRCR